MPKKDLQDFRNKVTFIKTNLKVCKLQPTQDVNTLELNCCDLLVLLSCLKMLPLISEPSKLFNDYILYRCS